MFQIQNLKQLKNSVPIFVIAFALFPAIAFAAELYLEPAEGEYHQVDIFIVEIRLDTEGEYINTGEINLVFSQDILEMKDFSKGNSILTLWVVEPSFSNQTGIISFTGGIPGGYQGENGLLGKIIFQAKEKGEGKLQFQETSQVLLNDGLGTKAELKTKETNFTILAEKLETSSDEWQEELEKDTIPPESFKIEVNQDSSIFDGKYFITFSTTDKQTGVDYYEIREGKRDWKRVTSPYLLEDQSLKSIIKIKAVDKADNERIVEYIPPKNPISYFVIILILTGIGIVAWKIYKIIKKK